VSSKKITFYYFLILFMTIMQDISGRYEDCARGTDGLNPVPSLHVGGQGISNL